MDLTNANTATLTARLAALQLLKQDEMVDREIAYISTLLKKRPKEKTDDDPS